MRVVLDTSAVIFLNDFRTFDEIFTVPDVIKEVRDKISYMKLSGIHLNIIEPAEKAVKEIITAAKSTGDLESLSDTDMKVLALGKERDLTVISDDYNIQNVAERLGIKYSSVANKKITKSIEWGNYCESCRKFRDSVKTCPKCGAKLFKRPKESASIDE